MKLYTLPWEKIGMVYMACGTVGLTSLGIVVWVFNWGIPQNSLVFLQYYIGGLLAIGLLKMRSDYEKVRTTAPSGK